jgi:hypothetical protein
MAAPGTDLSPDERDENNSLGSGIPVYDDPEAGYDSDDGNYNYGVSLQEFQYVEYELNTHLGCFATMGCSQINCSSIHGYP